ncbi:hypothetical protein [Leptolyngbya sp. FACHB-16]|uniref:hypothetical protein n=1 Tax=unclassified Leptolyngbya TaxID=2650499 RepID=UPI001689AD9D|nr:hypothetical protein [Leptolyngbya sp. FACHB-16]MBD2156037.1 hypothetical protein [Leptolyngbya sp. FACHB-16]
MSDTDRLIAEAVLDLKEVKAELRQLRAMVEGSPRLAEGWMDAAQAWQALKAEGVKSQKHLAKLRQSGAFSLTKGEIRNVSAGDRPTWQYHIPKCRKALQRYFSG